MSLILDIASIATPPTEIETRGNAWAILIQTKEKQYGQGHTK